ncbi:MAG: hypothetical protein V7750_00935 [Sneathiella sp.]
MSRDLPFPILAELKAENWHSAILMHRESCHWVDECPITEFDLEGEAKCLIAQLRLIAELNGIQEFEKQAVKLEEWCKKNRYRV